MGSYGDRDHDRQREDNCGTLEIVMYTRIHGQCQQRGLASSQQQVRLVELEGNLQSDFP